MPIQLKGQQAVTSSGIFTVPFGVTSVDVFIVGGGGSGGHTYNATLYGSGGGAGYTKTVKNINVIPGQQLSVIIGAGGSPVLYEKAGVAGGATSITIAGTTYSANGGNGGNYSSSGNDSGGNGGSGGGAWGNRAGGSDGSKGGANSSQGTTTRAFAESTNTLYAGGGGSSGAYNSVYDGSQWVDTHYPATSGGAGGGASGGGYNGNGGSGGANTGGGGGGATRSQNGYTIQTGAGGSGVVIIRWGY